MAETDKTKVIKRNDGEDSKRLLGTCNLRLGVERNVQAKCVETTVFRNGDSDSPTKINRSTRSKATTTVSEEHNFLPLPKWFDVEELTLFEALKEETGIKEPYKIYVDCYAEVKHLREKHVLDKYIVSDEEAATICTIHWLLKNRFDFEALFCSCIERPPSKFMLLILKSLRKLPRYNGTLYFGTGSGSPADKIKKGKLVSYPIFFASSSLGRINDSLEKKKRKKFFRVENCWGYDISEFICGEREKTGRVGRVVVLEPWLLFKTMNHGITDKNEKTSIIPLEVADGELIYESEILPGVSKHIVKLLKENIEDKQAVKRIVKALQAIKFDNRCT